MSTARDRAMREAGEKFDREEAASATRARAAAASATATRLLGQHPQFRNLAALTGANISKSPAGAAGGIHGQPAGRGTKAASKTGGNTPGGGGGKVARPASKSTKPDSRWAHFAGMTSPPIADEPVLTDITPAEAAAFISASAAKARGQKPGDASKRSAPIKADLSTPQGVAAFVAASAAKCRGPSR